MINSFNEILLKAKTFDKKMLSVACPESKDILSAVSRACSAGIIDAILVGNRDAMLQIASENRIDISCFEIINIEEQSEACLKAVELVSSGRAQFLMKGLVESCTILKAVLSDTVGLKSGSLLSHVSVLQLPSYPKLLTVTDAAINIAPTLSQKKEIIQNAVALNKAIGIPEPKVAVLCAIEHVNPKMTATMDAQKLAKMNRDGLIAGCIVSGPLALDNAISQKAASIKGIDNPVAGQADILVCPDIEAGNILYKALSFLTYAKSGSVVIGAKAPIVLTSRADCEDVKFNSIALGALCVENL